MSPLKETVDDIHEAVAKLEDDLKVGRHGMKLNGAVCMNRCAWVCRVCHTTDQPHEVDSGTAGG